MNVKRMCGLFLAVWLLGLQPALDAQAAPQTEYERQCAELAKPIPGLSEHDRLWKLFAVSWNYEMAEDPRWATYVGYPGHNGRWKDQSLKAIARRKREMEAPFLALKSIDRSKLGEDDRLHYDIFKYQLELDLEGRRFNSEVLAITQLNGIQQGLAKTLVASPQATVKDYEDILSRLNGVPAAVTETIILLQEGLKAGLTPPKITLRDVPDQILSQAVEDFEKNPMLEPFRRIPSSIPAQEAQRLRAQAGRIVAEKAAPAFKKLHVFFLNSYLPFCRESIAWSALPDGEAWYAYRARRNTTTRLVPMEIHEKGLSEVRRIRAEMETVIRETGFKGGFQDFIAYLRTDPKFFYDDPQELLRGYRDISKRIDPELIKLFGQLPRLPYGVVPIPAYSEKSQTTAYYYPGSLSAGRSGLFYANTYNLKARPKWEMEALTLHEAVPGHHMQISLAQEMADLPEFRKHGDFTAYTEGWGLYAESLGGELGLYKDPPSRFGQLTYEMWRAMRLVVDTGMHSLGWSRQQAIDFFKENSSKTEHDIIVEVDRYIVWPGQALAYKLGELKIKELRELARHELADRYDVRAFHDAVLSMGAVPLDVLEDQVKQWIAKVKSR